MSGKLKQVDLGGAMLQGGRQSPAAIAVIPMSEMPMVLTLDQLSPNPDNPRTSRNPRYEEIKASIRARGLDTVPKVTQDPNGATNIYIFSDGGNTRYEILCELWQETGDERFYRIHTLFKPWPGRLQCVIGHLAENEVRGELTFIEKAFGIHKARQIYQEQLQKNVSLRELSSLLAEQGLPVDNSTISRMENTLKYLYPWIPVLLESGLGGPQIRQLLALRQEAGRIWNQYQSAAAPAQVFDDVFGGCCRRFDSPEIWALEMFRDELIGDLVNALPHPLLNYDRWLLELDPKERNRRQLFGEQERLSPPDISSGNIPSPPCDIIPINSPAVAKPPTPSRRAEADNPDPINASGEQEASDAGITGSSTEFQPDLHAPAVMEVGSVSVGQIPPLSALAGSVAIAPDTQDVSVEGLEPVANIWTLSPLQDDIEHLQGMAFRLAFELAEALGCENEILPASSDTLSSGYCTANLADNSPLTSLLLSLCGVSSGGYLPSCLMDMLTGGVGQSEVPLLDDAQTIRFLRLIRVVRRLRELQRRIGPEPGAE